MDHVEHGGAEASSEVIAAQTPRLHQFQFSGQTGEFFRIWIVNLALTIVTLGIYSAWAKVRTQRYFHAHTRVADSPFEYLGNPWAILRGRIVLVVFVVAMNFLPTINPMLFLVVFGVFFFAMPFLVVSAMRFRLRNTAWRGLSFRFHGSYGEAFKYFVGWQILGMVSFGLLLPLAFYKQQCWMARSSAYGKTRFDVSFTAGDYYKLFLKTLGIMVGAVLVAAFLGGGLAGVSGIKNPIIIQLIVMACVMPAYLLVFAYSRARMVNLFVGNLKLAEHRFVSQLRVRDLMKLYAINTLALVLTLGLAYPWAQIRMSRYRAAQTQLMANDDLSQFSATVAANHSAVGEELGDYFDLDLGI